jgi:hypothetical protein
MAKLTITIEDVDDSLLIIGEPSMQSLLDKSKRRERLTIAESFALAAWAAIASQAAQLGDVQAGEKH